MAKAHHWLASTNSQ